PGRDMVLCRLSGLELEKTGVIAGMSGSPIYIEGKLLGAVAYAWPFGKEPIAGVTPFSQMHGYVESYEHRDLVEQADKPTRGGPLAVALVRGDFDLSGIGTVTHIEGHRVYGWGHPFFSLGTCEFPLMTGYIHTIYPRQSVSFKMGSPLRTVGVINADVSTCIA